MTYEEQADSQNDSKTKFLGENNSYSKYSEKSLKLGDSLNQDNEKASVSLDKGARGWMIMVGSFLCNGILFGIINSYGVLYEEILLEVQNQNVSNARGKAALAGSLSMGMTFFISPVSGILTDYMGIRITTFVGGAIAAIGMVSASFCTGNIVAFWFTYGILYGLGGALTYTPSLVVLGHYFSKYLGVVNGIVTAGSSCFTIVMPYILDYCIKSVGLIWTLRILAINVGLIMPLAFLFKPVKPPSCKKQVTFKDAINMSNFRNIKFIIWITVVGLCLFGYFVPYVYIIDFIKINFQDSVDNKLPVICIGIMSGITRPITGIIADRTRVDRILLQQLAFCTLGILTILLPFSSGSFVGILLICLGMGITDGCFISLLGPVAFEICGKDGAPQAIGFLLGMCSIPLTVGPYLAGVIYGYTESYTLPFILAGINPALASFGLLAIRRNRNSNNVQNVEQNGAADKLRSGVEGDDELVI